MGAEIKKLGRTEWVDAALAMLLEQGIDAVQITRLAQSLGVSRGSFYWHFDDRQSLLVAMLDTWETTNSSAVKDAVEKVDSLSLGVLSFFSLWLEGTRFSPALEQAVRDWARLDHQVMDIVQAQDAGRIAVMVKLFNRFGFGKDEANVRARVLYFAQIGYYALHMEESMEQRLAMLDLYYLSFTGQALEESVAADFVEKYRECS